MTEHLPNPGLKFDEYSRFVESTRFAEISDADWRAKYAKYVEGEMLELLIQHGNGMLVLLPDEVGYDRSGVPDELCYHMADEMGDSLWFTFDIAERAGLKISDCVVAALGSHDIEIDTPIDNFAALETVATDYENHISIINKRGLYGIEVKGMTSLRDNPQYVHSRAGARLSRALAQEHFDVGGPLAATSLEPVSDLGVAIGDYMLVQAYIGKDRLGVPIDDIARFNMAKLKHRRIHGKEKDLVFGPKVVS